MPTATLDSLMLTSGATYSQYLRALSSEWDKAKSLEAALQAARNKLDGLRDVAFV